MEKLIKIFICIFTASFLLYLYLDKQNEIMQLRLKIPRLEREIQQLQEKNIRLKYSIESFENPINLIEMSRKPEFSHLKNPYLDDIIIIPWGEKKDAP